jgi:hypothetical protein
MNSSVFSRSECSALKRTAGRARRAGRKLSAGRRVTISEFTFYRVEDGKFAEVWDLTDMDAVMRQIGQGEAPLRAPADEAGTADS